MGKRTMIWLLEVEVGPDQPQVDPGWEVTYRSGEMRVAPQRVRVVGLNTKRDEAEADTGKPPRRAGKSKRAQPGEGGGAG